MTFTDFVQVLNEPLESASVMKVTMRVDLLRRTI